jgi:archaellum component FlaC
LEELTGVVLSSAEVSTRSAEVAANISHEMREVMKIVSAATDRNILHSRVILIGLLAFLMIAVGTFFAISTRLQQNIRQLDSLSLAVGKRVVELDATLATFGDATRGLGDTTEKLDGMEERQAKLNETVETKMEDLNKLFVKLPDQISGQVNGQSEKALDAKLLAINKSIQALEAKVQALANKPAPAAPAASNNQKEVLAEIQKLKKDLGAANAKAAKETKEAAKERDKAAEYKQPPLQLPGAEKPAPAAKAADAKAAQTKAEAARAAEAKAAEEAAAAEAKAAAEAEAAAAASAEAEANTEEAGAEA